MTNIDQNKGKVNRNWYYFLFEQTSFRHESNDKN